MPPFNRVLPYAILPALVIWDVLHIYTFKMFL